MRCIDVVKRLNKEKDWDINKSQLLYYDSMGIVVPKRDRFLRRNYTENDYTQLKWVIRLSKAHISLSAIKEIVALDYDIMELTVQALKEKSKNDWATAKKIEDNIEETNKRKHGQSIDLV